MLYALLKTVHVSSIILWLGGMIFAQFFLRPAPVSYTHLDVYKRQVPSFPMTSATAIA